MDSDKRPVRYLECGCCGYFHKESFTGDCRNDDARYGLDDLDGVDIDLIIALEN